MSTILSNASEKSVLSYKIYSDVKHEIHCNFSQQLKRLEEMVYRIEFKKYDIFNSIINL